MQIITHPNTAAVAGQHLSDRLRHYRDTPILLLVSGGSALSLLDHVTLTDDRASITVSVLDERFSVTAEHTNFEQLRHTELYRHGQAVGVEFISTAFDGIDEVEAAARVLEDRWKAWKTKHSNGVVMATMGIGADGHVAGLLDVAETTQATGWVLGYRVPSTVNQYTQRVTATYTFLEEVVDETIVYAIGNEKSRYLQMIQEEIVADTALPVSVLPRMREVRIFTDQVM